MLHYGVMVVSVQKNGVISGPFTETQVREMLKSGKLSNADTARTTDEGKWEPLFSFDFVRPDAQLPLPLDAEPVPRGHEKAAQGHANAQFQLGLAYYSGDGVMRNVVSAARWFRLAAAQGEPSAQHNLALAYYHGIGVDKDSDEAIRWARMAAKQDNNDARQWLESLEIEVAEPVFDPSVPPTKPTTHNNYTPHLRPKATTWEVAGWLTGGAVMFGIIAFVLKINLLPPTPQITTRPAYQENPAAQTAPWEDIVKRAQKGASHGNAVAQNILGRAYSSGEGIEKDQTKAVALWEQASKNGNPDAFYNLGWAYYNGEGTAKDEQAAIKCWRESADRGNLEAKEALAAARNKGLIQEN